MLKISSNHRHDDVISQNRIRIKTIQIAAIISGLNLSDIFIKQCLEFRLRRLNTFEKQPPKGGTPNVLL